MGSAPGPVAGRRPARALATPGGEGAGEVLEVGEGVETLRPGDRVAYTVPVGAYAEERVLPADRLVKVPDEVELETAAAMMLKGMTAQYLLRRTYPVKKGDSIWMAPYCQQWATTMGKEPSVYIYYKNVNRFPTVM